MIVQSYNFGQEFPNMNMSRERYILYCAQQREMRVTTMCKPVSAIRNKSPQELLELGGQLNKVPVDLTALLKKLKISCIPFDFSELEVAKYGTKDLENVDHILGALVTNGDNAAILYRAQDQIDGHRSRFTIAHELGHCCLAHYQIGESTVHLSFRHERTTDNIQEVAANIFAGELLVPRTTLESVIDELILPSVQTLADIFAVSTNVMLERLRYLKITTNIIGYNY